jgi:hypothetical protein
MDFVWNASGIDMGVFGFAAGVKEPDRGPPGACRQFWSDFQISSALALVPAGPSASLSRVIGSGHRLVPPKRLA